MAFNKTGDAQPMGILGPDDLKRNDKSCPLCGEQYSDEEQHEKECQGSTPVEG